MDTLREDGAAAPRMDLNSFARELLEGLLNTMMDEQASEPGAVGVASELREDLVSGDPHRHGEPELVFHALRYLACHEHLVPSEERQRSCDVDP